MISKIFNYFGGSTLEMLSIFIPYIFKFKDKSTTSKIKCTKIIFIDYSIYFLLYLLIFGLNKLINYFNIQAVSLDNIYIGISIQMVCYFILSIIILKSKYYIHHIISFIFFCIFTVIIDLIFNNFKDITSSIFLLSIPNFIDDILSVYQKYLIDKKYYSYLNILFFNGLYSLVIHIIESAIIIKKIHMIIQFSNLLELLK